jgi:uncharacterized protein (TIGR03083 family)
MEKSECLEAIEREASHILTIVEDPGVDLARPVPTCPGWTLDDLPSHLGRVYAMVTTVLGGDPNSPPDRSKIPSRPEAQAPSSWMRDRLAILLDALRQVADDARFWNFATGPASPVSFWWRRQAHETLIHRVDADLAAGGPVAAPTVDLAADGIDDFLAVSGFRQVTAEQLAPGSGLTLELRAGDVRGPGWSVSTDEPLFTRDTRSADVVVHGTAWALDLWCWQRDVPAVILAEEVRFDGDRHAAEEWRPVR